MGKITDLWRQFRADFDVGLATAALKRLNDKRDEADLVRLHRLMSNPEALRIIADAVSGSTPLCGVIERAVESQLDGNRDVDADDVKRLDEEIEKGILHYMRHEFRNGADDVEDLDQFVDDRIEKAGEKLIDSIVDDRSIIKRLVEAVSSDERLLDEMTSAVIAELVNRIQR
jgi:hypothetical protein